MSLHSILNKLTGNGKLDPELWRRAAEKRTQFTPDLLKLSEKRKHFLFVYDEMKINFPAYNALKGAAFVCNGITVQNTFEVYLRQTTTVKSVVAVNVPAPDPKDFRFDPRKPGPGRIRGQLHLVPAETLFELDEAMANGLYFDRQKVKVRLPWTGRNYQKVRGMWIVSDEDNYLPAYAYIAGPEAIEEDKNLKLVSRFVPRTRDNNGHYVHDIPYYEFTRNDLNGI